MALLPIVIGAALWIFNKKVVWYEWIISAAIGFVISGIIHACAVFGQAADIQTLSGQITYAKHFPAWKEYYQEAIYKTEYYNDTEYYTDSNGRRQSRTVTKSRRVFSHWEDRTRWHSEHWKAYSSLGDVYSIDAQKYKYFVEKFSDNHPVTGQRRTGEHNSKMIEGDPNDYVSNNKTQWIEPITKLVTWENKIKAAPSVFSFSQVPKNIPVYDWPKNDDPWRSNRILGKGYMIDRLSWDQMNSRLGPTKRVNVILIGFGDQPSDIVDYQRAKWIGGKKNDLVLCFGGNWNDVKWTRVFGWTESELVKSNLQSILLENKIDNNIIPLIEQEIKKNYRIKDWKKFDYLRADVPNWAYWTCFLSMITIQGIYWIFALNNDTTKDRPRRRGSYKDRYLHRL